jgi:hypothetical protein
MKKFLATILALVYFTASTGATVNFHFCMGKLKSWDFSSNKKSACEVCGMDKSGHKGCCKDEQKVFKVQKDHKAAESSFQFSKVLQDAITVGYSDLPIIYTSSLAILNPTSNAPPRNEKVPVFLLNCNFRI